MHAHCQGNEGTTSLYNVVFIQSLRAFRRAEIIFDVVLFERSVGGVAVPMTLASIFQCEIWFLWDVVSGSFLGVFWKPLRVLRASLGILRCSFGGPGAAFLGSSEVILAAEACLRGPLGVPGGLAATRLPRSVPGDALGVFGAALKEDLERT